MNLSTLILAVALSSVAGCATERPARAAAVDPSNPAAPEAAPLVALSLQPAASPQAQPAPEGAKGDVIYTCPMHPEVVSPKPGTCPKCGMKLVPKAPASAPEKTK